MGRNQAIALCGALALGLTCVAADARATLAATSQTRHVIAMGGITDGGATTLSDTDETHSLDFSPFAASAAVVLDCGTAGDGERPGLCVTFVGTATQDSRITLSSVAMTGTAEASADGYETSDESNGRAQSSFRLTFDLLQATSFTFDAAADALRGGTARIQLAGPGVLIDLDAAGDRSFSGTITLGAGSYTLTADAFARAYAQGSASAYGYGVVDFRLTEVPEPAAIALLGSGIAALGARRTRRI